MIPFLASALYIEKGIKIGFEPPKRTAFQIRLLLTLSATALIFHRSSLGVGSLTLFFIFNTYLHLDPLLAFVVQVAVGLQQLLQ